MFLFGCVSFIHNPKLNLSQSLTPNPIWIQGAGKVGCAMGRLPIRVRISIRVRVRIMVRVRTRFRVRISIRVRVKAGEVGCAMGRVSHFDKIIRDPKWISK